MTQPQPHESDSCTCDMVTPGWPHQPQCPFAGQIESKGLDSLGSTWSSARRLVSEAQGMCTDQAPHEEINAVLDRAQRALDERQAVLGRARRSGLSLDRIKLPCGVCHERGVIPGFWYGTTKTCPACHGRGCR